MSSHAAPDSVLAAALADRYRVERTIGTGGMGTVYLAHDLKLGRPVALKVLRPEVASALGTERFLREIALTARLEHPLIVPLHDSGTAAGCLYYVMPFVDGRSLRERIGHGSGLPAAETARVLRDVLDALSYAHEQGVVHRDIKPDNVLLRSRHALVTDFGIAKAVQASATTDALTAPHTLLGTPSYMAPEQAAGTGVVDARTDLYAVGVMAYEMLAGTPPFQAATVQDLLAMHLAQRPVPLLERRTDLPPRLAALVMRCLEKKPEDRWSGADEMLALLEAGTRAARRTGPGITTRRGVLSVAVDESSTPPYCLGEPGTTGFRGLEVDLLERLAHRLGVVLHCRRLAWEAALTGLRGGDLDMVCRALTITPERRRILDFSVPYLETELVLATRRTSPIRTFDDLAGRAVGVRLSTFAEALVARADAVGLVRTFALSTESYEALRAGVVDAVVDHLPTASFVARSFPDLHVATRLAGTRLELGIGFARGSDRLRRATDAALLDLRRDGTWAASLRRWLAEAHAV